jgi:hypothetical protein
MGKRSNFDRNKHDFYPTPYEAVVPLLPFLFRHTEFIEPCSGKGDLVKHLEHNGHICVGAYDINDNFSQYDDATLAQYDIDPLTQFFITNPPWSRDILHPIITNLRLQARTWLLLDADWMHTRQASEYLEYCNMIVSVGRVKWIPDSKHTGKDNCAWYYFTDTPCITEFYGRN